MSLLRSEFFRDAFLEVGYAPLDMQSTELVKIIFWGFSATLANLLATGFTNEPSEAWRGELCV